MWVFWRVVIVWIILLCMMLICFFLMRSWIMVFLRLGFFMWFFWSFIFFIIIRFMLVVFCCFLSSIISCVMGCLIVFGVGVVRMMSFIGVLKELGCSFFVFWEL